METYNRKATFEELKKYCYLSKDNDFIEVTEWKNGDGFDIELNCHREIQRFSLTHGEFQLLTILVNLYKGE